jgi:hypothetical protein
MDPVQPAGHDPMVDRAPPKPDVHELPVGDHAMLPSRQRSDLQVTWSISFTYVMYEVDHPPSVAHQALQLRTRV